MQLENSHNTPSPSLPTPSLDIIAALREQAKENQAFNAMCHIFALRERTRQQITLNNLALSMSKEGFIFTKDQYARCLIFFASLGIGKLDYDINGNLRALKNIKLTLQSIGLAAVSKKENLDNFKPQAKFTKLPVPSVVLKQKKTTEVVPSSPPSSPLPLLSSNTTTTVATQPTYEASVTVLIDGKPIVFPLPDKISPKELGEILSQTRTKK